MPLPDNDRGRPMREAASQMSYGDASMVDPGDRASTQRGRGRRRVLEVEFDGVGSLVRGHGSRELVTEVTGRPPVWRTLARGWSVQEHTARDVVALAERRYYDVVVLGPQATRQKGQDNDRAPVTPVTPQTPAPDPEGLW